MSTNDSCNTTPKYLGERLGLPEEGPAAMARLGRRFLALFIDWFVASVIAWMIVPVNTPTWLPLVVFLVLTWLSLSILSATVGKMLARIQVVRVGGARIGWGKAAIRTILLGLVIPVVIVDSDGRGLHDVAVNTVEIQS